MPLFGQSQLARLLLSCPSSMSATKCSNGQFAERMDEEKLRDKGVKRRVQRRHGVTALGFAGAMLAAFSGFSPPSQPAGETVVRLTINPAQVIHRVDEKIYAHFLEHIYHSVHGGLWGEMVWNRSFEEVPSEGLWSVDNGTLVQEAIAENVRLVFGDLRWSDYEFTLEAQKVDGHEGFLVLFRVQSDRDFYWLNLGGWDNTRHAIERGRTGQGRWRVVSPMVPGRIEAGHWYRIRLRCEGNRFQVWLNDHRLLDFTDNEAPILQGGVGVGTWNTRARFRNLKITALDGTVLFQGLPQVAPTPTARHWQVVGTGVFALTTDNPLNSQRCQLVACSDGEAGVRQAPMSVRAGEKYHGSVWVRGKAPNGLVVRLRDGRRTLAEQRLPAPIGTWREVTFTLTPRASANDAALELVALPPARVWLDQVSLMAESSRRTGGFRPDLLDALKGLRPTAIRWPGGCFASAYRWKDGIGPQHQRRTYPRPIWDDLEVNAFGTDEFIRLCRLVGAEPILVINIGTRLWNGANADEQAFLQDAMDWVEYCNGAATSRWGRMRAVNGHPEPYAVKLWEIDNETWHMGAEAYAEAVRRFVPALKKVDPTIKIIACGSGGLGEGALRWNRTLIERCAELIDYLSIHHYEDPNRFADGPAAFERFIRETAKIVANSRNPNIKLFVSEWNAQSTDWRTGLYAAGLLNVFERCGDVVEIASPALLMRHWRSGVRPDGQREWDNAFINFDHRTWFPAPNYVVMKLWRDHYAPFVVAMEGLAHPLNAIATKSADGKTVFIKVVNPSSQTVSAIWQIAADSLVVNAKVSVVAPGDLSARNALTAPHRVRPRSAKTRHDGQTVQITLPPFSAAVVTVQLK
jgi:alpha-N-arabinofuranosidase